MKKFVNSFFIVLFSILFFSCEIGLGEAVDTMPPEVAILSPDVESIIRDSFLVHGTWKDDGEIDSVSLTLTRTDGSGKTYGPFPASFDTYENKEGVWDCVINPAPADGERILDGTYEVEVAITDKGEHTSTIVRQLSIDNTAPLLILQRPVTDISVEDANTYEYGQLFTLEGQVSDESNVHHIDIEVYADSKFTDLKKVITVDNVSSTINIDIARFSDGGAYTDIYGYSSIDEAIAANQLSAVRYCKIITYDNAKRYPVEGNESVDDSHGNSTSEFYVYDDVNTADLLGKYKITELYKMQSGTYTLTDSSRAAESGAVLTSLVSKKKGASKFRLNPRNNPVFSVSGKPTAISNNSNIVLEVKPGLDGYVLQKDSLRPYILACDETGKALVENISANRIYLADAGNCEKSGSNYKFNVALLQGTTSKNYETGRSEANMLLVNHYYLFGFEGSDIKGKPVMSDGVTVFKFESNENANRLTSYISKDNSTWTPANGKDLYIKNDSEIYIKGEAVGVESNISSLISVKVNGSSEKIALTVNEAARTMLEGYYTQPFTAKINISDLAMVNDTDYTLVISAGTPISDETVIIKYDNEPPAVEFGEPSPYEKIYLDDWVWGTKFKEDKDVYYPASADKDKKYLNGTAIANISISDNDSVSEAVVKFQTQKLDENNDPVPGEFETVITSEPRKNNFSNWAESFDTTKLNDNALMRMVVTATDRSGNSCTVTSGEYNVFQLSDYPTVVKGDDSVCLKPSPTSDELNKRSPGASLSFILYDDDGVKKVTPKLYDGETLISDTNAETVTYNDNEIQSKTYYTYKISSNLGSKQYEFELEVTDKIGSSKTTEKFPLKITAPDPVVTVVPDVDYVTTKTGAAVVEPVTKVKNTIKVVSTGAPFKVERRIREGDTVKVDYTVIKTDPEKANPDWCFNKTEIVDEFTPPAGADSKKYAVDYRVTDVDGITESGLHFGVGSADFYIDNDAPKVTDISKIPDPENKETAASSGKIEGKAEETGTIKSGLRKIQYKIDGDDDTEIADAVGTTSWNANVYYENHSALTANHGNTWKEGNKKIKVRAIDNAGNVGSWKDSSEFVFDRADPEVEITKYVLKDSTTEKNIEDNKFNYGYKFSLKGTASDSYKLKETGSVTVKQNGVVIATLTPDASGNWTVTDLPRKPDDSTAFNGDAETLVANDGTYEYTVVVEDSVKKTTTSDKVTMVVDHVAPVLKVTMPAADSSGSVSGSVATFDAKANDPFVSGGTDNGGTGVKAILYAFDGTAPYTFIENNSDTLSLRKILEEGTGSVEADRLSEGMHVLHIKAVDNAGNESALQDKTFYVDLSSPEVEITGLTPVLVNGKYLNAATGKNLKIAGKIKETNELKSFVITGPASPINFTIGNTYDKANQKLKAKEASSSGWKQEWEYTHTDIPEGEITYTFTAQDVRNRTNTTLTQKVFVDTVPPVIDVNKIKVPDVTDTQEAFFTFTGESGAVTESGSGLNKVEIGFSNASGPESTKIIQSSKTEVTFENKGSGMYTWSSIVQFSDFSTFNDEGPKKLWVRATDEAGNSSDWVTKEFTYDTAAPESTLEITNPTKIDDKYRNADFEIQGDASDNYGVQTVKLEAIKTSVTPNVTKELTLTKSDLTGKNGVHWSWSTTTDELPKVNGKADGTYTFKLTVTDLAKKSDGTYKTYTTEKSVIIDTTPPVIQSTNIVSENSIDGTRPQKIEISPGNVWYNTRTIKLKVTPDEDASGINTISYTLKPAAERSAANKDSDWTDLAKGTFKGSVTLPADGPNTVYFRIKDNAGNVNYETVDTCYKVFNIDTTAPSLSKVYDDLGKELTGEIFVDENADVSFNLYVEAEADEGDAANASGLKVLKVGDVESTLVTDDISVNYGRYEISIPSNKRTSGDLIIEAYDNVNNKATITPCKLRLDSDSPVITLNSPDYYDSKNENYKNLNGNIVISADITDYLGTTHSKPDGKLKSIEVRYSIDETEPSETDKDKWYVFDDGEETFVDHDSYYPTSAKETINIAHRFSAPKKQLAVVGAGKDAKLKLKDTDSKTSDQTVWVKIEVKDQANHTTTKIFKMVVDRNSDRPVIKVNNVNMGSDMSSTKHKWLLNTIQLKGTVEDDDDINGMYIRLESETDNDWKPVTVSGTNWIFNLTDLNSIADEDAANGKKNLYFKVVDKENNTFISKADTEDFENIYLRDGSTDYGILYIKPETKAPDLEVDGVTLTSKNSFDKQYSSLCIGGTEHSFKIRFKASDANDIASATVLAAFAPYDSTSKVEPVTVTAEGPDSEEFYVATFENIKDAKNNELSKSNQAGTIELTVSVRDTYGRESQENQRVKYDYKFPDITRTAPEESVINTGSVTAYGEISESSEVSYALSLSGTVKPSTNTAITSWTGTKADETGTRITAADNKATANVTPAYTKISNTASSWFLYFDGETSSGDDHGKLLKQFLIDSEVTYDGVACTEQNIINQSFTNVVDVYLWIRAKDYVGNVTETPFKIQVDSQGERPEVSIAYPGTPNEFVANTVNIYGSAKPAEGNEMANVWVQLISSKHEKTGFSSSNAAGSLGGSANAMTIGVKDLDYMAYAGYDVYNMKTYKTDKTKWVSGSSTVASGYTASDYGILVATNGSTGWSLKINEQKELDSTETNRVGIAVYAQDAAGHISKRAAQYINFDAAKPKITKVYLKNADGTIVKEYKDNMWISGEWYLTFTATDNQKIKTVSVGTSEISKPEGATEKEWNVSYKISDSSSSGKITTSIEVSDGDNTTPKAITINVDNNKPTFDQSKDNIEPTVKNSNGYYNFGSKVNEPENESGIDYIAFYFLRGNDVFDVMYAQTHNSNKKTIAAADSTDHLRWVTSSIASADSNTITLNAENANAHKGGLVKVKGTIYKIENVNGTKITVVGNLESMDSGDVQFAIANVVDNTIMERSGGTKETAAANYAYGYGTPTLDDGDRMVEYLSKDGSWNASINSRNIRDGAITLCCVAFDKAGNASDLKTKDLYVSNNAPRIAGITIKTDKNGNDSVDDAGETITNYNSSNVSANKYYDPDPETIVAGKTVLDQIFNVGLSTVPFTTIKGRTEIVPEIVGGNGNITYKYHWKKADGSDAHPDLKGSSSTVVAEGSTDYTAVTGNKINIQIGDLAKAGDTVITDEDGNVTTGNPDCLTITFRDSIRSGASNAETEQDISYQSAILNMYFNVDVIAEGNPASVIDDFYWTDATKNSVYDTTEKKIKGHIELPDELPAGFTENNGTDTLMDRDAKVSGQIILTGSASDAGKIIELWFHIDKMDLSGAEIREKYLVGTDWTKQKPASGTYETYYCFAEEVNKILTSKVTGFTLTKNTYGADEHEVEWKYIWNTENISGKAAKDVKIKVQAVNQGTPSCSRLESGASGYETAKVGLDGTTRYAEPEYAGKNITANVQVDVVPYIRELKTKLSKANPDNSSEYGRSALGSYPVFYYTAGSTEKDSIEVVGYNITSDATVNFENYSGETAVTATMSDSKFELPENAKTGKIFVTVNDVESLNNKNNDDAKGDYDSSNLNEDKLGTYTEYRHYYNRQPNNINNDQLTDDISLSIWELNGEAVKVSSDLTRPVMHVNPSNGMIGFAYSNGDKFYMPNGNSSTASEWATAWNAFNSVGFNYDTKGNTFGVEMGTDSNGLTSSKFRIVASVWGTTPYWMREYGNYRALRLESHHGNAERFDTHPKLVATNPDANNANVYLMYYDPEPDDGEYKINPGDKLKLRCGTIPLSKLKVTNEGDGGDYAGQNTTDTFGDFYDDAYRHSGSNTDSAAERYKYYNPTNYAHCSVVVNKNSTYKPGTEYSIAVVPANTISGVTTDTLVAVWVDPINNTLVYGYLNNPLENNHKDKDGNKITDATPNNSWELTPILENMAGGYCSIATDKAGGVHIAYYSKERNGSLKYTYIPTPSGTPQTCFVDSYGATGKNVTIDFAYDGSKYIPYIGYYNSMKKPKYAYLVNTASASTTAGSPWQPKPGVDENDMCTGTWETMFVPTVSAVDATDGIQLGVYRGTDGKRAAIIKRTARGTVGGNGTDNPVIGYATSVSGNGHMEIAQLK